MVLARSATNEPAPGARRPPLARLSPLLLPRRRRPVQQLPPRPEADQAVAAGADQALAVGRERQVVDAADVAAQDSDLLPLLHVDDADLAVGRPGEQQRAVGRE